MPKFMLDGVETEYTPGQTILDVTHALGKDVPHYCWHPGLTVAGNCRICLVEVRGPRGPQSVIACNTQISEGMDVHTQSERAKKDRRDVMELLLINHPLDCPICDQAGECKLQEYSYEIGSDHSRFEFAKVHKPKNVRFSEKVTFDAERCILCTRCVRFCDEVAGEDELAIVNRGDRNEIAVARGGELENDYQMNTIDICPVGALTSSDFRFKSRVWFLKQQRTVCGACSRGCNTTVGVRWNRILRMVPAENADVNQWWMCDDGRMAFDHVEADDRLGAPMRKQGGALVECGWDEALAAAVDGLAAAGTDAIAIVSARLTNEELFLARRLVDALGIRHTATKPRDWPKDDLLRTGDGNPNTRGAALFDFDDSTALADLPWDTAKAVFLCGEDLDDHPELLEKLAGIDFVVSLDFRETRSALAADVVLAGQTHFEKDGSFTNIDARAQRIMPVVQAPGESWPDWKVLDRMAARADGGDTHTQAGAVLRSLAASRSEFDGFTLGRLGPKGKLLALAPELSAEEASA